LAEPVTNYIPELLKTDPRYANITLQHLMDMRSGLDIREGSYDLKDDAVKLGLRPNLKKHLLKVRIAEPPGRLRYQSANTQFLGWVVERATGKRLYTYLEEKLWQPLGMEHDATWNIDSRKHKQVMTSAGINAVARDFAKLGRLYLQQGVWNGKHIISERWVEAVANVDSMQKYNGYKHQWWARQASRIFADSFSATHFRRNTPYTDQVRKSGDSYRVGYRSGAFSAIGFMNQVIYVHPSKNLVIVRIGKRWGSYGTFIRYIYNLGEEL
jgi:CubicO group peptidase (beta-lactamase class C family)